MCASDIKTVQMRVAGLVQGVGFRAFVVRQATQLGIKGFVRNAYDGAVEIEAQGRPEAIERFVLQVRQGPRTARVDDLSLESVSEGPVHQSFDIRW